MEILKGVFKKSIFIILPAAIASGFIFEPRKVPLGILMGWIFGIFNLRSLTRSVEGIVGTEKATFKLVLLSLTRLLILFIAIIVLIYFKIVNVFGLLFGFTVVFILILVEGVRAGKGMGGKQQTGNSKQ